MRNTVHPRLAASWLLLVAGCVQTANVGPNTIKKCSGSSCPVAADAVIAAEVVPSTMNGAPLPSQEVAMVMLDATDGTFQIALDAPVTLSGTVSTQSAQPQAVAATILATRPSRISGRPDVAYSTTVDPNTGRFSLAVSPTLTGEAYIVRVLPQGDTSVSPPQTLYVDASMDRQIQVQLSDPSKLLQLHGTVTDALQRPVAGMQVLAVDPATSTTLSTTTTTDATGAFAIKLGPAPVTVGGAKAPPAITMVRVTATAPKGAILPSLELAVDVSHPGAANSLSVNLMVPPLPAPTQLVYTVLGAGSSGTMAPVVAARCQFAADVSDASSGVIATYSVEANTDAEGKAALTLIPAGDGNRDYQLAVSPPTTSDFQATVTTVSVGPTGGYAAPIVLGERAQVTGRVVGPDKTPLKGLMVEPTPATLATALLQPSASMIEPRGASVVTDAEGKYLLRLDAGASTMGMAAVGYDLALIPPPTSMLPRLWVDNLQISGNADLPDVALPAGAQIEGTIRDAAGNPLAGADVRIYSIVPGNDSCNGDFTCLSPPRLTAQGSSAADGSVLVLLPAR